MKKHDSHHFLLTSLLLISAQTVHAAGFALTEKSGSSIGNAFAGAASAAEDSSTILSNPAGLTRIDGTQLVLAGYAIQSSINFHNHDSRTLQGVADQKLAGGLGGDAGSLALVPTLYFATDLNHHLKLGLGIHSPFGLKTEYDDDWVGRYEAIKSSLKTVNINPALAYKVNDRLSLGVGVNAQYIKAELSNAIDFGSVCALGGVGACAAPQSRDGQLKLEGNDWSWGYNLGLLAEPVKGTRVGLAYRSKVSHHLQGDAAFSNVPLQLSALPDLANRDIKADIVLPETAAVSILHQVSDKWDVMADVLWTRWSQFKELRIERSNDALLGVTQQHWENTRRYSVGASYKYHETLKLRFGIAYDESPVSDAFRNPRIPDNDRWVLGLGASYKVSASDVLDFGYLRIFMKDSSLHNSNPVTAVAPAITRSLSGSYGNEVHVLSMQYVHTF